MALTPVRIKRLKDDRLQGVGLEIEWSNGDVVQVPSKALRDHCPCASCGEKRGNDTHANPLGAPRSGRALLKVVETTAEDALNLKQLWNVGNYAIGILWGDGHDSGIYSYPVLREVCDRPREGT